MKRFFAALLALCVLTLAGCAKDAPPADVPEPPQSEPPQSELPQPLTGEQPDAPAAPEPPSSDEGLAILNCDGLEIPIPDEYAALVLPETDLEAPSEHWTPLLSLSEQASLDAFAADYPDRDGEAWGVGWLCSIVRLDRIGFEKWISDDTTGSSVFAVDDAGRYYLISRPTDVTLYRHGMDDGGVPEDLGGWNDLNTWTYEQLPLSITGRNGLTAYNASDLFEADYTYGGEHVELGCRFPGEPMDLVVLSISQPARQGEGGVWCVERIREVYSDYNFTDIHLVFPAVLGFDMTAADYYETLQAECDAGEHPELLTPAGAALDYARRTAWLFGEDVSATDFEIMEALG